MNQIAPAQIGLRVDYDLWQDPQVVKDAIAIHYGGPAVSGYDAGASREREVLRAWERFHIDSRGWRGIAYGYAIGASGNVYRLRGKNRYGAHLGDVDNDGVSNNAEIIPVVFILGDQQEPTPAMWRSFGQLKTWLTSQEWTKQTLLVYGHREVQPSKPTLCPGDLIMAGIQTRIWESSMWEQPGDPVVTDDDVERVWRYMTGQPFPGPRLAAGWLGDALMRHDARIRDLENRSD